MTRFAKYIDENNVKFPPKNLKTPHLIAFNFDKNEALLRQEGYLPLVELNTPEEVIDETHYAKPQYALIEATEPETIVENLINDETGEEFEKTTIIDKDVSYITVTYIAEEYNPEESEGD